MFDFEGETAWDIDAEAESLNTSLFGRSKRKKSKNSSLATSVPTDRQLSSFIIQDSDDEQYSKKGKKKLKERRRRRNKKGEQTTKESSSVYAKEDKVNLKRVKNPNVNASKEQKSSSKTVKSVLQKSSDIQVIHSDVLTNKKEKKKKKAKETPMDTDSPIPQNSMKRKRVPSEGGDSDAGSINSKKIKLDDNKMESEKKKRKRNRKKKNNSKKNKYKHLALNSKAQTLDGSKRHEAADKTHFDKEVHEQKSKEGEIIGTASKKSQSLIEKVHDKSPTLSQKNLKKPRDSQDTESQPAKKQKPKKQLTALQIDLVQGVDNGSSSPQKQKKTLKRPKAYVENSPTNNFHQHKQIVSSPSDKKQFVPSKLSKEFKLKQQKLLKLLDKSVGHEADGLDIQKNEESSVQNKKKKKQKDALGSSHQLNGDSKPHMTLNQGSKNTKNILKTGKKEVSSQGTANSPKISSNTLSRSPTVAALWGKASELGQQAQEKLNAARFRYLNEQLYTSKGDEAMTLFKEDREAFNVYHQGFESQTSKWPVNPLNVIIKQIKEKPTNLVIADFGCGDARLAKSVPHKVHSFDLVALNNRVTACDMSKTPLPNEKVDIAVFCLSLMGTNISDYIHEANRVLKTGGLLKIAEVVSRFSGLSRFTEGVCSHGFQFLNKRDLSEMFYMMDFRKVKSVKKSATTKDIKLKPCVYKKR